jgi:hypothetical protein
MTDGKKAGNGNSSQNQSGELGSFIDKHNRLTTIVGGVGVVLAIAVGFIFYQVGKSDAVEEAEEKGYEQGIARGLKTVEENQTSAIKLKFAKILKDAEIASEKRGFVRGFLEGERVGLEKGKKLGREQ